MLSYFRNTLDFSYYNNANVKESHTQAKFLHITDLHVDPFYMTGSKISTACHQKEKKSKSPDIGAGPLGDRACDAPVGLAMATLNWIKDHHGDEIDFVVWTGDSARHDSDNSLRRTKEEIYDVNKNMSLLMYNTFSQSPLSSKKSIPIIPTFGNNDIYPHNILYGGNKGKRVFEKFLDIWKPFIPKDQYETFLTGGYFAVDVVPNHLKVISLNTMYFYNSNAAVDSCSKKSSPGHQQLEWLQKQLRQTKKEGTKIVIIGHVPPIPKAYYSSCYRQYSKLALKYDGVISGHLYGHLNMDHFLILGDEDTTKHGNQHEEAALADDTISINRNIPKYLKALRDSYRSVNYVNDGKVHHAVINISPSVIPEMNPTFRIFRYEADEKASTFGDLVGYTQWFANLTHWNTHQPKHNAKLILQGENHVLSSRKGHKDDNNNDNANIPYLEYEVEYDTLEDYKMEDLSTDSWLSLARDLGGEGHTSEELWNNYAYRMFVQSKDVKDLA
ncbi:hypothetical protein K450DRAFT_215845 [Umbelopsis ramanniana AG]|uniref:Calcineurin-like phosphoesterase domain-containing protein n=1 Tax=Umbelopsis ramanniana AG TaxID=1314678 RepID=A0AAD5E283_UMBRA|nr:uncharacterized protein K450DRAFT_215845 [Umbelopsis ramanniana AG]KAI8575382.1 hypothetical protein K450DRAFT_215845 [Umbelopsis ramanniana AG]